MANFEIAYKWMISHEDNPNTVADDYISPECDKNGGETYKGISRLNNSNWQGWDIVDKYKMMINFPLCLAASDVLQSAVKELYRHNYWDAVWGDKIINQNIANKVFDACVNPGPISIKFIQRVLNTIKTTVKGPYTIPFVGAPLSVDGTMGPHTLELLNSIHEDEFMDLFRAQLKEYYDNHADPKYIDGWKNRAET